MSKQKWFPEKWKGIVPIRYERIELTAAEILLLHTTPKTLVAAPGAGKVLEFVSAALFLDHGGTAYTGGGNLTVQTITGNTPLSAVLSNAFLQSATTDAYAILGALEVGTVSNVNDGLELLAASIYAAGNGTLTVHVAYRVHDFN